MAFAASVKIFQTFSIVKWSSDEPIHQPALGLNIKSTNNPTSTEHLTFLENIYSSHIVSPKFWFNFRSFKEVVAEKFQKPSNGRVGALVFGDPDPSSYKSSIKYVSKHLSSRWGFVANATIGTLNLCDNCIISFNASVKGILLPAGIYSNIKKSILDAFKPGCSNPINCSLSSFPTVKFQIDEIVLSFSPEEYIFLGKDGNDTIRTIFEEGEQSVILGRAFLAKYFVEFDFAEQKIGFAERNSSFMIRSSTFLTFLLALWRFLSC